MKNKLVLGAIASLLVGGAQAATVAMTNTGTDVGSSLGIAYSGTSNAASGGIVSAGYFLTLSDSQVATLAASPTVANIAILVADFQSVLTTTLGSLVAGSSLYNASSDTISLPNATKSGAGLYTFIGNSGTLLGSNQFILWDHPAIIDAVDSVAQPDSNSLLLAQEGSPLISGGNTTITVDLSSAGGPSNFQLNAVQFLNPIPEPSTALLGAIGALGLLRRRR